LKRGLAGGASHIHSNQRGEDKEKLGVGKGKNIIDRSNDLEVKSKRV
jgi:hypothetical protein